MAEPKMAKFIAVEACLDDLFTNGNGSEAERLVLMLPGNIDGGGWGRAVVRDKLAELFDAGVQHGLFKWDETIDEATAGAAEATFEMYQRGATGSFFTHFFDALQVADPINRKKLRKAFPEHVAAFERWHQEAKDL